MKKVLGTMVVFAVIMIGGAGAISMMITAMVGGGVAESYIYPIYGGIILLAGLVVGCTYVILVEIKDLKKLFEETRN